jgi:hypothetical protein
MRHGFLTTSVLVGALFAGACGDTGQPQTESSTQSEDVKATARRPHPKGPSKDGGSSQRDAGGSRDAGSSPRDSAGSRDAGGSQRGPTGSRDGGAG